MRLLSLVLIAVLLVCPACAESSRIMLCTYYRQMGWGDEMQAGWVCEDGKAYTLEGNWGDMDIPNQENGMLDFLAENDKAVYEGEIDSDDLFDLKSLVACVSDENIVDLGGANDAGTEASRAVRYSSDGSREVILLGMSGDENKENTDPNAQALYKALRTLFPRVWNYAGEGNMGPIGFKSVNLMEFCGVENADLTGATVEVSDMDCEEGPRTREISKEEASEFLKRLPEFVVTGKKSAVSVTGGTAVWTVSDANGKYIASFEFYKGTLVRNDGMYTVK